MCARSGANCGSLFLDLRFRELVRTLLADHPAHLDAASLAYFMHSFSETDKLAYRGEVDDRAWNLCCFSAAAHKCHFLADSTFNFTCFNVEDPDDPRVGLVNGELSIPGNLLRHEVFDPVVNQVLYHTFLTFLRSSFLEAITCTVVYAKFRCCTGTRTDRRTNEECQPTHRCPPSRGRVLRKRIPVQESRSQWSHHTVYDARLGKDILNAICYLGTVRGTSEGYCASAGCRYSHGAWRSTIWPSTPSSRIFCGCASIIYDEGNFVYTLTYHKLHAYRVLIRTQVKLPAEQEDFMKRPAYVSQNNAGVAICENR
jgi:hypothetical protein